MAEPVTISFVGDTDIEAALKAWAEQEDRSVSAVIRLIILAERARRAPRLPLAVADENPETPQQQMKDNGAAPLPLVEA